MPTVSLGPCIWMPSPYGEPSPAMITQIGKRTLNLIVFSPDSKVGHLRDGVRHASDPDLTRTVASGEAGCWDYTSDQKRIFELERSLGVTDAGDF
jgi:hypothetical protein